MQNPTRFQKASKLKLEPKSSVMERIFGDLPFVIVYLDDLLVFSSNEDEHLDHLRVTFERLEQYDVTLNGKKCYILRTSVEYLGYTLTSNGIQPQEKKIQAIKMISVPRNRKELRRFLGMINYYRDMIPNKAAFPFHVYADASGKQIGGIIMQHNQILACFSKALNKHQVNYTTMELELLSIVELLKEYRTMLLGFEIIVHTDHKNLIYPTETSLRVKRWKLLLEEYRLKVKYIKGDTNVGADAFSRMRFDTTETFNCLNELLASSTEDRMCPFQGSTIKAMQEQDEMINQIKSACLAGNNNSDYKLRQMLGSTLVTYQGRVLIPESLREDLISWYHHNLGHPGAERQFKTMQPTFYWPGMEASIKQHTSKCITCKRAKLKGGRQAYAQVPLRTMKHVDPWDVVHVDLIGPYDDGHYAITMIDHATRWLEIGIQPDKRSVTTAECFDREWLCRYPRPLQVIHDLGTEFTSREFQEMLESYAIKSKPTTAKNPQANAICERQIVFGQDMITRQLYDVSWSYLSKRRFEAILTANDRENAQRLTHFYKPGDNVMLRVPKPFRVTTQPVADGPYTLKTVHANGTVTIDKGTTTQQVSIRRIFPC
ncbi:hypothetical protein P43SY_008411 [Pythium insidiosum]|uniref:Uncharacterized protein n=1 Tax=Pythium insidiosum TaxID=114742 RepID=A0AAD5L6H3_PYTIN|nr:hypothetical protein P43SY_008411 [Pythium insidiosum]